MTRGGIASVKQLELPLGRPGDETATGEGKEDTPVGVLKLMERVLERENLLMALRQVKRNKGGPGIDGMTVEQLPDHLREHWSSIKAALLDGTYKPRPVKRVEIPKLGGGVRKLGVPTVVDRFIQQALLQVLQADWDPTFSSSSFGFRPDRSAHQALAQAQGYLRGGYTWVVDIDLEKFFDRVNHDVLMRKVRARVEDRRVLVLINRFLKAGVSSKGDVEPAREGTPQGGPLSPLLANLLLDGLDKELERRGHRFARYADDCNVYVRSRVAGERVMASLRRFLARRLKLRINEEKSAVDRPWRRTFLGFTFTGRRPNRRKVSIKAVKAFKTNVREITRRTRGHAISRVIAELGTFLLGWKGYFGYAEVTSPLRDLEKWIRLRLRCYLWKQWGLRGYRELRRRGVDRELAWNTCKSAHGPWRLSQSPALYHALPNRYFAEHGLPSLVGN